MKSFEKIIRDSSLYFKLFGDNPRIIQSKKRMLETVWDIFKERFFQDSNKNEVCLISVPNRVELLGKHTDYQGGETFLLTGPKNFFAVCAASGDGITELVNADTELGETVLKLEGPEPRMISEGVGSQYTRTVVKRLSSNLVGAGFPPLKNVKAVFMGDVPFGGGTSGSSAKLITDFFIFATVNGLLADQSFISLVIENGRKAGLRMGQAGTDDFILALSMYLAHHENGFDFGDLKGDRGVGTFGGSEDHTAILLGKTGKLLLCRYCPTEVLEILDMPGDYSIAVAYSGRIAEKTKEAMAKYNRLSEEASSSVAALNEMCRTEFSLLRDFFSENAIEEKGDYAYGLLMKSKKENRLAERSYQFFKEREIIERAMSYLKTGNMVAFGKLLDESHEHSRLCLRNIVPEIDFLQKSAKSLGALGATGFGAGFGGSCYAVAKTHNCSEFMNKWREEYHRNYPHFIQKAQFDEYPACCGCYWEIFNGE